MSTAGKSTEYIEYLPEVFRRKSVSGESPFLADYLKIFEALLSGREDTDTESVDRRIRDFRNRIDASLTPIDDPDSDILDSEFLTYTARWVALTLDQNWELDKKRQWLRRIVSLYKKRGTLAGLTEYLHMFVGDQVSVKELPGGITIAETSTIAEDTFIAGGPAYYFKVNINYGFDQQVFNIDAWRNRQQGTKTIVDLEKPAHTYYDLDARTPGFIVAERATIGKDTLLWKKSNPIV